MRCDQTQTLLFDYVDDRLADQVRMEVGDHLETCSDCHSDYQGILDLQAQANVWHELPVPKWQPPAIPARSLFGNFQQWFPSLASAAAPSGQQRSPLAFSLQPSPWGETGRQGVVPLPKALTP